MPASAFPASSGSSPQACCNHSCAARSPARSRRLRSGSAAAISASTEAVEIRSMASRRTPVSLSVRAIWIRRAASSAVKALTASVRTRTSLWRCLGRKRSAIPMGRRGIYAEALPTTSGLPRPRLPQPYPWGLLRSASVGSTNNQEVVMSLGREGAHGQDRLATFEELLDAQRESAPPCPYCHRNCADRVRNQELAMEAMRTHIRVLEAAWDLEREGMAK